METEERTIVRVMRTEIIGVRTETRVATIEGEKGAIEEKTRIVKETSLIAMMEASTTRVTSGTRIMAATKTEIEETRMTMKIGTEATVEEIAAARKEGTDGGERTTETARTSGASIEDESLEGADTSEEELTGADTIVATKNGEPVAGTELAGATGEVGGCSGVTGGYMSLLWTASGQNENLQRPIDNERPGVEVRSHNN